MGLFLVLLYKGKGDKYPCTSFRGISLLRVVGKVYGRVWMNRIRKGTKISDEHCSLRRGSGCVDQCLL